MLIVIRGLPGSGKSYLGRQIQAQSQQPIPIFEADQFFEQNGEFCFVAQQLQEAHRWCREQVKFNLPKQDVIVANTFVSLAELMPYWKLAASCNTRVLVLEPLTSWAKDPDECFARGQHQVPLATIQRMAHQWMEFPTGEYYARSLYNEDLM